MKTNSQRPILVTGAHRSGTTWVGKMLSASGETGYISEPLNKLHRRGVMNAPVPFWYLYITKENQEIYRTALAKTINFEYQTWQEIGSIRSLEDAGRMLRDYNIFRKGKKQHLRPLLKDPFAVFSAAWFAKTWNSQVVITVRHPAAFTSSLKRLGWQFDFDDLLNQPQLMQDWLHPFAQEIQAQTKSKTDIIDQSILLWRLIYFVVAQYKEKYPEFTIIRHEDISINPIESFRSLYRLLNLSFTQSAQKAIEAATNSQNPVEASQKDIYTTHLNSQASLKNWKHRLSPDEIDRIREGTRDIASYFYTAKDWE